MMVKCLSSLTWITLGYTALKEESKDKTTSVSLTTCIQLFRQRLSHKSIKAYGTMPIGIMGRKILELID